MVLKNPTNSSLKVERLAFYIPSKHFKINYFFLNYAFFVFNAPFAVNIYFFFTLVQLRYEKRKDFIGLLVTVSKIYSKEYVTP